MTQQPYGQPYPAAQPQQQYPTQPAYPAPPQQQPYPQAVPQQGYPAPYPQAPYGAAPQTPPQQPLAQGTLDDYYAQPSTGGGPSLSWTDKQSQQPKPLGTKYIGVVARDVTNADVQQQTDFRTQAPLFYKDGRPKFAMKVPLRLQPSQEFPDGEASWFVKGQARDELARAMAEAGCQGAPKAGATIEVELVQRRNTGAGMNPANVVRVSYRPADSQQGQQPAPVQQPVQQQAPQQEPAPQWAQPQPQGAPQLAMEPQYQAPVQQQAPQQTPQVPQQMAPQGQPQAPAQMDPAQAALLYQLTNGQQGAPLPQGAPAA